MVCLTGFLVLVVSFFGGLGFLSLCCLVFSVFGGRDFCWFGISARLALWFGIVGLEIKLKKNPLAKE